MNNTKTMYENQRSITVYKNSYSGKKPIYGKIGDDALKTAYMTLSKNGVALWLYIARNQPGYTFGLSRVAVMDYCNISKNSYHRAFKELVEAGYLIQTGSNAYDFQEMPQMPIITVRESHYKDLDIDDLVDSISG